MLKQRFSLAAKTYDKHASPQLKLAKHVMSFLPKTQPTQLLELGAGTGQLTRLLANQFPNSLIHVIDLSEKMIEHGRSLFTDFPQIHWQVADAETFQAKTTHPLIISSSALHWVNDLEKTFRTTYNNLDAGGLFAFGFMLKDTLKELQDIRQQVAPNKAQTHFLPTYNEVITALNLVGFSIEKAQHNIDRVTYSSAAHFLKAIHEQGVTGGKTSQDTLPLTRSELRLLTQKYQTKYATSEGVFASYETIIVLAKKA